MGSFNKPRGRHRRGRGARKPLAQMDFPVCPLCQKAVRDLSSAISHKESGKPAHFDCILSTIRQAHGVQPNEKVCYLGKGSFGIVQFRQNAGPLRFFIRKRIQYEEADLFPEWRKVPFAATLTPFSS